MKLSLILIALFGCSALSHGQTADATATPPASSATLDTVLVYGEAEDDAVIQHPFPLAVEGNKIFAGKRATVIDLDALPKVQANNYRQALALTPGLLFSEETTPLVSIGYRGIGEPHRMQFMQVLKDGVPIHADPFGYPEAYYTPPLDTVDRIEFIRGGGSLMYGPQPGGAFNYVTYMPQRNSPFSFRTQNIFGSDELFSSYTAVDGTLGQLGYLGYFNHRESQGFRERNSQYKLNGGHLKLVWDFDDDTRLIFGFDGYEEEHGEPGGLTARDFARNPERTTRNHDEFRLRRYIGNVELQHRIQTGTELNVKAWGGYYQRWSKRQRGGGFGTRPAGGASLTNNIENQEFYSFGIEPRLRHDWEGLGGQHTLAAGMQFYYVDSPREDKRGRSFDAEDGVTFLDSERSTTYGSFFAENKFTYGKFSITPGFRMELVKQDVHSRNFNATTGVPTGEVTKSKLDSQPLFGLGMALDFDNQTQLYANVSQSYRTTIFTESIVAQPGLTATDTDPSLGWSYEIGYRGTPREWLAFDTSLFLIDLDNRFGVSGGQLRSVGRSINYGWDGAVQFDIIGGLDAARGTKLADSLGALNLYANVSLLEAELHGGPNDGATPQYAPDFILRTGMIYKKKGVKVSFLGTFVDDHNARDDADPRFAIPGYMTWDLTAEIPVTENLNLMAGINNVFDESYYSRVRNDGIDPGYGRNFYVGGSVSF
ncbi:MAG TPA: TonB-dependent receptor [Prosthecobacter sp.]|nr:TonB-dependent receptor [Prosthecobacter sp.]HRK14395.1 TonB-dependent receptor [Prosthecobacter sp.]